MNIRNSGEEKAAFLDDIAIEIGLDVNKEACKLIEQPSFKLSRQIITIGEEKKLSNPKIDDELLKLEGELVSTPRFCKDSIRGAGNFLQFNQAAVEEIDSSESSSFLEDGESLVDHDELNENDSLLELALQTSPRRASKESMLKENLCVIGDKVLSIASPFGNSIFSFPEPQMLIKDSVSHKKGQSLNRIGSIESRGVEILSRMGSFQDPSLR